MAYGDLWPYLAHKLAEENIEHAVIAAYRNALKGPKMCGAARLTRGCASIECVIPAFPKPSPAASRANNLLCSLAPARARRGPCAVIGKDGPQRRIDRLKPLVRLRLQISRHRRKRQPEVRRREDAS